MRLATAMHALERGGDGVFRPGHEPSAYWRAFAASLPRSLPSIPSYLSEA